jgi:hypothetical protein
VTDSSTKKPKKYTRTPYFPPGEKATPQAEVERRSKLCSMPNCDNPPRPRQRYCVKCHKLYMKAWRAKRKLAEEKLKESVLRMRAKLVAQGKKIAELEAER